MFFKKYPGEKKPKESEESFEKRSRKKFLMKTFEERETQKEKKWLKGLVDSSFVYYEEK
jgi:hypothetical protein